MPGFSHYLIRASRPSGPSPPPLSITRLAQVPRGAEVSVQTFHSFALTNIKANHTRLGFQRDPFVLDETAKFDKCCPTPPSSHYLPRIPLEALTAGLNARVRLDAECAPDAGSGSASRICRLNRYPRPGFLP